MSQPTTSARLRESVAEEIRVLLARRRLSAAKLAQQLGWSQPYMARRMAGAQTFDLDDIEQIADALGVGVVDLLPRDRRDGRPTDREDDAPVVTGTFAHPANPIIAAAIRLPQSGIPQPRGRIRPAPTGL